MGSSSSSRSGCDSSNRARATRRRSPPRQRRHGRVARRAAQRVHRLVEHLVELPGARGVDLVLEPGELVRGLVGVVHRELVEAVEQLAQPAHAVLDVAAHVLALVQPRLLLEQPHGGAGSQRRLAAIVGVLAGHDPQQRRLARAVQPQHADLRTREEAQGDVLEDCLVRRMDPAQFVHRVDVLARHRAPQHRKRRSRVYEAELVCRRGGERAEKPPAGESRPGSLDLRWVYQSGPLPIIRNMRPLIGVTTSELRPSAMATTRRHGEPAHPEMALGMTYLRTLDQAGAIPVVLPPTGTDHLAPADRAPGRHLPLRRPRSGPDRLRRARAPP